MKLRVAYLYPDAMNLYGDYGNILSILMRCRWRGIEVELLRVRKGDESGIEDADVLFMGGGQDSAQLSIAQDLVAKGPQISEAVESGAAALVICGGYQLFGRYFKTREGHDIPGIGIFDAYTEAGTERMIGNVLIDCGDFAGEIREKNPGSALAALEPLELVGFENHSGKTYLGEGCRPLGKVKHGFGNDGSGKWEGCRYLNAFGTYLHGPLLPKNPWLTDYLIQAGLEHRYGRAVRLAELDDAMERAAFATAKKKAMTAKTPHL